MNKKAKTVLLVYGMGGHAAQMNRLAEHFVPIDGKDKMYLTFSDQGNKPYWSNKHILGEEIRDKQSSTGLFGLCKGILNSLTQSIKIFKMYNIRLVISTGPGAVIIPSIIARLLGVRVIHLETWSRIETYSFTGRLMYRIASEFWIQHRSLQMLYPKAKFVGLL
ncbi:PssD/Cps14F family polysaccharide biosynthesis glycosyltransferase [Alteromonadaceae bacterium BrNp21-10]|nr:PssD/Cps14F family polysaccharide biosynthesis glycosyltransferase [Alteromonadaceae bacterium BrNp21-10]